MSFARKNGGMATSRLDWTREEIILAMDLYMRSGSLGGGSIPGKASAAVLELSELLHQLNAYPPSQQGDRYRNPEGVYLKLTNLRAIETHGRHGMNAFSQLDAAVWREYIEDPPALHEEAEAIRRRLTDGALDVASHDPRVVDVPVERQHTEWYLSHPTGEPRENERAEQSLVLRYKAWMEAKDVVVLRRRYSPPGEVRPIYCDAWLPSRNLLVEAKNSDSRTNIRLAIGQLYDYRRFHDVPPLLGVLLPYPPFADRLDLVRSAGVQPIWPHGHGFRSTGRGYT